MKVKIDGTLYDPPARKLSMGEQLLLQKEYGWKSSDGVDFDDPSHIAAFIYMTLRERLPDAPPRRLVDQVAAVTEVDLVADDGGELSTEQIKEMSDPTSAPSESASESGAKPDKASK